MVKYQKATGVNLEEPTPVDPTDVFREHVPGRPPPSPAPAVPAAETATIITTEELPEPTTEDLPDL